MIDILAQGLNIDTSHIESAHVDLVKKDFKRTSQQLGWIHITQLGKLSTIKQREQLFQSKARLIQKENRPESEQTPVENKHLKCGALGKPIKVQCQFFFSFILFLIPLHNFSSSDFFQITLQKLETQIQSFYNQDSIPVKYLLRTFAELEGYFFFLQL